MHDALHRWAVEHSKRLPARVEPEPVTYRRYVMRTDHTATSDPELAASNACLADLADRTNDER